MTRLTPLVAFLGFALLASGPLCAQDAAAPEPTEKETLAEALLQRAEAASRSRFDPRFRAAALRALLELSEEELRSRAERGAGLGPLFVGESGAQLVYTPVAPCRILDTRLAGGSLAAGSPRDFDVTGGDLSTQGGSATGCGVPDGPATAAIINFVAVNPVGAGNLRAWAYSMPPVLPPTASVLNYASVPGLNIANGIAVPMCDPSLTTCTRDIRVQADVSNTHLVADVVGYFERFRREQVRSFSSSGTATAVETPINTCAQVSSAEVTVSPQVAGLVRVRANVRVSISHVQGTEDEMRLVATTTAASCPPSAFTNFSVPAAAPTGVYRNTLSLGGGFPVVAGPQTFFINAAMVSGGGDGDTAIVPVIEATYHPN